MATSGIAKVQHYVPQFLLRKFGNGKKDQLNVFDKHTGRSFPSNAKNVASESRFYDYQIGDEGATVEPNLAELESATKPIFEKILENDSTSILNENERETIATFLAVQFTRTKAAREQVVEIPRMLGEHFRSIGYTHEDLSSIAELVELPDENDLKVQSVHMMLTAPENYGPHFINKDWLLVATSLKAPFIIGDHPIALQNSIKMGPFGNLGIAVKGIEIYLPLSPVRALALWCPSHREIALDAANNLRKLRAFAPHLISKFIRDPDGIESLERALLNSTPLQYFLPLHNY